MSEAEERFIAAALAPLEENAEMQVMAGEELRDALQRGKIKAGKAEELARRLGGAGRSRRVLQWLYGLVAVVSAVALGFGVQDYRRWETGSGTLIGMSDPIQGMVPVLPFHRSLMIPPEEIFGKLDPEDEELLFGATHPEYWNRFLRLHHRYPKDPVLYSEHLKQNAGWGKLPANFLQTADEIDPENGWFRYLVAGCEARAAVHTLGSGKYIRYQIRDPAALTEALSLMEEAAKRPRFDAYRDEVLLRRLALLAPGNDVLGRLFVQEYVSSEGGADHFVHRALGDAIAAKAEELAANGETEAFQKLCATQRILARRVIENARSTTGDALWAAVVLKSPHPSTMEKAARDLGLHHESERFRKIQADLQELGVQREARRTDEFYGKGSITATRTRWDAFSGQALDFDLMKPGVKAEHALVDRFLCYGGWVLLLIAAGLAAMCRFRHGKQARLLSLSLLRTTTAKDHAWIIGCGIVLPFACYLIAEKVPVLAGTESSVSRTGLGNVVRLAAAVAMMVSLPVMIATWRQGLSLGNFPKSRWKWIGWIALMVTVAAWVGGCTVGNGVGESWSAELFQACLIAAGTCVAWFFAIRMLGVMVRGRGEVLRGMVLCRTVIPAYGCGMLLMAAASFLFHAEEKAWIAKDRFTKIDPAVPAANRFDHETAMQIRGESLEVLEGRP